MAHLITNTVEPDTAGWRAVERFAEQVLTRGPAVTSLLHGMTDRKSSVAFTDRVRVLSGEPVIRERLLDLTYEIGPNTFFQTNTRGAELLFGQVLEWTGGRPEDTVWDLYCGAGALTLPLARTARRVIGVELVPEAIAAAERNARNNGIDNVDFLGGDIRERLLELPERPGVVVMDPPREGVHADVLEAVAGAGPRRIVYVSCNPATLARDLALLSELGYRTEAVQPVDMFPHTPHVECVARLAPR
jgi:23S rRNA (uracil1939-C5)-methyltransferase